MTPGPYNLLPALLLLLVCAGTEPGAAQSALDEAFRERVESTEAGSAAPVNRATETDTPAPFSRSSIGIEAGRGIGASLIDDYWERTDGLTLFWTLPFYFGEIELQASWLPMRAIRPEQPDMNNILTTLGWNLPVRLGDRFTVVGSIHIGNNFMYRRIEGPLDSPESEFSAGAAARIRYRVTDRIYLQAGIHHTRVYTFHRMEMSYAGAGIRYHFDTPRWLRLFLD